MSGFCLLLFHACGKQAAACAKGKAWEKGPEERLGKEASVLYDLKKVLGPKSS